MPEATLRKLGRYQLIRVLGRGAMGVVYEARDPNLDRSVAIKTVKVENLSGQAAADYDHRFRMEARSAARLQHPHIVSIYDSDRDGDIAYLVMEHVRGDDLKRHLDRGMRYPLERSLRIVGDLLSALDYAHRQGIVHRDVKPANLLLAEPDGRVKLTDFGVARIQDSGDATRTQGAMVGTLKYMAPEQVQGHRVDARADVFAAGVVLYELLTDRRPFDGENDFAVIQRIVGHVPPPPSSIHPLLPPALDAVVARALAKAPADRFATAGEFALALQEARRQAADLAVLPPPGPARRDEGISTRPPTGSGEAGVGSVSTVTQELELVYWKAVKDATEREDLQGFLQRFPDGLYADLARRRLQRLENREIPAARARAEMPLPVAAPGPPALGAPTPSLHGVEQPATLPRAGASGRPPAASRDRWFASSGPAPASADVPPVPRWAAPAEPRRPAPLRWAGAAMVLLALGAAAAVLLKGGWGGAGPTPQQSGAVTVLPVGAASLASAAMPSGPAPSTRAVAVHASAAPATAASAASAASPPPESQGSNAAVGPASASSEAAGGPAVASGSAPPGTAATATAPRRNERRTLPPARVEPAAEPRPVAVLTAPPESASAAAAEPSPQPPAVATPPVRLVSSPAEQCRDKVFLSRELCLKANCHKPGALNHPLCVQYRDEVRLREDGRLRQGPRTGVAP